MDKEEFKKYVLKLNINIDEDKLNKLDIFSTIDSSIFFTFPDAYLEIVPFDLKPNFFAISS